MAFNESQLRAQFDAGGTNRVVVIQQYIPGDTCTDMYIVGITAPYAGRARWMQIDNTLSTADAWTAVQEALA